MARVTAKTGIEFTHHDLRRSFATFLEGELGVHEGIVSRLLNHAPRNVTAKHYIKTKATRYQDEANRLYDWIEGDHDWATDSGEGQFNALVDALEGDIAQAYQHLLLYVLYGDDLKALAKEAVEFDRKYIDPDVDPVERVPYNWLQPRET